MSLLSKNIKNHRNNQLGPQRLSHICKCSTNSLWSSTKVDPTYLPVNMALALFINIFKQIKISAKGVSNKSVLLLIELPIGIAYWLLLFRCGLPFVLPIVLPYWIESPYTMSAAFKVLGLSKSSGFQSPQKSLVACCWVPLGRNDTVAEWHSGGMPQCQNDTMSEWQYNSPSDSKRNQ